MYSGFVGLGGSTILGSTTGLDASTVLGSSAGLGSTTVLGSNQNTDSVIIDAKESSLAPTQKPQQPLLTHSTPPPVKPLENLKPAEQKKITEAAPEGNNI